MTTYGTDTFATGGRGSPNAWSPGSDGSNWTQQRGNQSLSVASNQGVMTYNSNTNLGVMTYTSLQKSVIEVLVNVTANSSSDTIGAVLCYVDTNNFYYADIGNISGKFEIGKDISGTFTSLASATFSWSSGTKYTIRFQYGVTTNTLNAKIWDASTAEPGSWTVTATDSSLSSGGYFGVCGVPVPSATCVFDTFSAGVPSVSVTDSITASETFLLTDQISTTDTGTTTESFSLSDQLSFTDTFTSSEILLLTDQSSFTDSVSSSEAISLFLTQTFPTDTTSSSDSVSFVSQVSPIDSL